ncbi:MAG: tRNA uracil 4-sulfurtransferase ThiI [Candidatus Thorarchaeota archaeon]
MPHYTAVLVRYAELGIKSKRTRRRMQQLLARNIRLALEESSVEYETVREEFGRLFVITHDARRASQVVSRVFGVVSASPVVEISSRLDEILDVGCQVAEEVLRPNVSLAVRARRFGNHEYTSQDIRSQLGARILEVLAHRGLRVDLDCPEQIVAVEVRDERAYIYADTDQGFGGMPTGSQGKVVCTVSTGLDSPVAAFKVMKRGCVPVFVYFDNSPYTDSRCRDVAIAQARRLAGYIYGEEVKMYIIPHGDDLEDVLHHCPSKMICVMCKRNMLRLAREVAFREGADAIVTGEIIGEQASQTTANLRVISSAVSDYPVLRPCAGDDKSDVERMAQRIGTYEFAQQSLTCCTLPPRYPSIQADLHRVLECESEMDLSVIRKELDRAEILYLRTSAGEPAGA